MNVLYLIPVVTAVYVITNYIALKKLNFSKIISSGISVLSAAMIGPFFIMIGVSLYTPSGVELILGKTIKLYLISSAIYFIFFMFPLWISGRMVSRAS